MESNKTLATLCNLSVSQVSDFREIFRQIDLDNNGSIDEEELGQLLQSIHNDEHLCSEEYIRELMTKVKAVQVDSNIERDAMEFTFEELMLSILKRPKVDYTKADVLNAFATLSGTQGRGGVINCEKLSRAIRYGAGGIPKHEAEEIMTMLEHTPTATFDYVELCDLLMGHKDVAQSMEHERIMMERCRKSVQEASNFHSQRNSSILKKNRKFSTAARVQKIKTRQNLKKAKEKKQDPQALLLQAAFGIAKKMDSAPSAFDNSSRTLPKI